MRICNRKIQGQYNHDKAHYRCHYPREYALANHVQHLLNVYVRECNVLPALDAWLAKLFAPHYIHDTIERLTTHQEVTATANAPATQEDDQDTAALLAECDAKLVTYRAAIAARTTAHTDRKLSQDEINQLIQALTDIRTVIELANPADKARIYEELGLELTYDPGKHVVRTEISVGPNIHSWNVRTQKSSEATTISNQTSKSGGVMVRVRGGIDTITPRNPWRLITDLPLSRHSGSAEPLLRV